MKIVEVAPFDLIRLLNMEEDEISWALNDGKSLIIDDLDIEQRYSITQAPNQVATPSDVRNLLIHKMGSDVISIKYKYGVPKEVRADYKVQNGAIVKT